MLAVLANDRLEPWINWTTLGPPLLRPLAAATGRYVAAPPWGWRHRREWAGAVRTVRQAEAVFWMQGSSRPETPLTALSAAAGRARRVAYVVDPWESVLPRIALAARLQHLDPCFVAFREASRDLADRYPRGRFEWLPFGVDTDVFTPGDEDRDVFAFWMGRRHEPLHGALLTYCARRGLIYRYRQGSRMLSTDELGRMARRARYFVVTPPDLDDPGRTGRYSPLVMRYLEGLAAGARLLGVLPGSGEYERLLPREAILEVEPDGSDLAERLAADRDDPDGWRAAAMAGAHVRAHHSWARRAEQIADRLRWGRTIDLAPPPPVSAGAETPSTSKGAP